MKSTSLRASVIDYLYSREGRPAFLKEIYSAVSAQRGVKNDNNFRGQVRGVLNYSILKREGVFERIHRGHGLYGVVIEQDTFDNYLKRIEDREKIVEEKEKVKEEENALARAEALKIYNQHINFAYREANKMHKTSCIVPLEDLQSVGQIALYSGACTFNKNKTTCDGLSPIPYLKKCIQGKLLNALREQKLWQHRNLRFDSVDAMSALNVDNFEEVVDSNTNLMDDVSGGEIREILIAQMRKHLNDDEFEIISKRYGLDGKGGLTFKQIGEEIAKSGKRGHNATSAKSWSWKVEKTARQKLFNNGGLLKKLFEANYGS